MSTSPPVLHTKMESSALPFRIQEYLQTHKAKLYILTPTYGSMCHVNYMCALIKTIETFRLFNFPLQVEFCKNDSLVSRARNNLIAKAMFDEETTHIMFIDSDITWDPMDIFKLILSEKPLVGGIYPMKHYFWDKLVPTPGEKKTPVETMIDRKNGNAYLSNVISDQDMIQYNLLKYNMNYVSNHLTITNNLAEVRHLATGFMLIHRPLLESMMKEFPATKYCDDVSFLMPEENKYAYALFDCGVEEGHYFSEDWLFCHRWTKMGGKIYVDVSISLVHSGMEDYRGCFISSIIS
jgi:hypothetical protein